MQKHRIFIAINLSENIRNKLAGYREKYPELPARWTRSENLHITMAFIGQTSDEGLAETCEIVKKVAEKHQPFLVSINKICYGPKDSSVYAEEIKPPRMIWAIGEKSKEFSAIRKDLDDLLLGSEEIRFSADGKEFSPHITLARIRAWEWVKIEPEERPQINEDVDINFSVDSIEVMESQLKRGGPNYEIIESFPLGN
jgi:RNA 2',3'-cyclic 3'-phosphodiesterase